MNSSILHDDNNNNNKDHNRHITSNQNQSAQQQQHIQQLNSSPKVSTCGLKGKSLISALVSSPLKQENAIEKGAGEDTESNSRISLVHTPQSPITNENSLFNNNVQNQKKQQSLHKQQKIIESKSPTREAVLEERLEHANKGVETLGVLLQYLVYDLDAFACQPTKICYNNAQKNLIETRLLLEDAKTTCDDLQDKLQDKDAYYLAREAQLQDLYRCELKQVETALNELQLSTKDRIQTLESKLTEQTFEYEKKLKDHIRLSENKYGEYEKQIQLTKEKESELLKRINVLSMKENELRDKIQESESCFAERLRVASLKERELTEKNNVLNKQLSELGNKLELSHDEISVLRLSSNKSCGDSVISSPKNGSPPSNGERVSFSETNKIQTLEDEIESLRYVLKLKQSELSEMRIKNQEMQTIIEELPAMQLKVSTYESRLEDLQSQLKARAYDEKELIQKNKHLQDSLTHHSEKNNLLKRHNEELQWRLKKNSEKLCILLSELPKSNQKEFSFLNSSSLSITRVNSQENLDNSQSFALSNNCSRISESEHCENDMNNDHQLSLPAVKGVVEKSDSVSWVFEMDDEPPEVIASRLLRRAGSFRLSANFNEKSPHCSKRQHTHSTSSVNPLTQSASATSVLRQHSNDYSIETNHPPVTSRIRSKSVTMKSEQKRVMRQNSIPSSGRPELVSSCWKDSIGGSSTPYSRRSCGNRLQQKNIPNLMISGSSKQTKSRERADSFNTDNDENGLFSQKYEPNLITCDTSVLTSSSLKRVEQHSLPTHPSVQDLKNLKKCQEVQESAGEAMVSGTNSEDEGCSASSDEAALLSSSTTSTTSSSSSSLLETDKHHDMSIDNLLLEKNNCSSLVSTPMEISLSDDGEHYPSESVV